MYTMKRSKKPKRRQSHHTPPACHSRRLSHFQLKPAFHTTYSEKPPTPQLPNFTFASIALFLNQVMRKQKDDFSDIIIMDGIVGKKKNQR